MITDPKECLVWNSHHGAAETNPTRNHELVGSIPGLAQWATDLVLPVTLTLYPSSYRVSGLHYTMICGVVCRCGSDLVLLWLWCGLAATALIRPLAWEPPHAMGVALKRQKDKKKTKKRMHGTWLDSVGSASFLGQQLPRNQRLTPSGLKLEWDKAVNGLNYMLYRS